ncbi:MAG: DEAD/DEAH box helicase [Anaerolineales bacterium]|nr:DEAD/DEAH box helicase [Anaerolineales bacterium]
MSSLYFDGGTLVLSDRPETVKTPEPFQWIKAKWRCEAYHYPIVSAWCKQQGIRDTVPRWERLKLEMHDGRIPHDYQKAALEAWDTAERRGSIVLPTGAGKTFVAIQAIQQVKRSTLVVAPTIDLLHQWYARLVNAFEIPVGVYYGGEKTIEPLTVTTYHSAGDLIADYGNQFKLIIYDEVHHLPAPSWGETALMSPAPLRLGLTATYPEQADEDNIWVNGRRWDIAELIGPIVYQERIDDLVGKQLADYRTERIRVDLTDKEQQAYDADYAIYSHFFRSRQLHRKHGRNWLLKLTQMSAYDEEARKALLARQRLQQLLAGAEGKVKTVANLLREHKGQQALIFTENNTVVYQLSNRYLIPALTHETKAAERKLILDEYRQGTFPVIVTSKVLNEGVDVPEAKIAIVLGGTAGAREYIQRLGRVLRKAGNREAVLYEVIVRNTVDEGRAQRRRPKKK